MLASFLRPPRSQRRRSRTDRLTSPSYQPTHSPAAKQNRQHRERSFASYGEDDTFTEEEEEEDVEEDTENDSNDDGREDEVDEAESEDDSEDDDTPLLPIFSSAHLDALSVYTLTHAIRELVTSRCETVLSWEQLRSPQVSQFLLKPIQREIRAHHFNAATEYALIANCLQFNKEGAMFSGNSGTSKTRAMLCELLAIKMLREYSTRELIDALSYDFDPLQGQIEATTITLNETRPSVETVRRPYHKAARISCYEVALRAQSKRFLAHPLVVQQLEAIWAGTIVFHSAADSLHRKSMGLKQHRNYGTTVEQPAKSDRLQEEQVTLRRAVTIYNPREASLFKLSRLRVPRYRNILSTMSFAVLLALFLAVLVQRSLEITTLEVFFWFWAAGYMLDEIVGFSEQGFSLYIASFWNTFDLGILLILFIHLCLRLYGIVMPDVRKHTVANMAYDVLAADAILLFPRLFSVLDHYRYFSQLLIAFRMMAQDLVAVFVLILISCSGFFVALTLSFGNDGIDTPSSVAYALLQMIMGFTPAAWDRWDGYNALGKTILTLFLFICHFLVVTILITVLTNSFMAIVRNANEEHQFVFAVNTISNVKSDALFSYVAPTNLIQWLLTPLRYFIPFRQYVKVNRTIIKGTHFPILFTIYLYERTILGTSVYDSIDVVENRGRDKKAYNSKLNGLAREPSITTFRQDRALEEVFRQPFDSTMRSAQPSRDRRKTSNVVNNWMKGIGEEATTPTQDQDRKTEGMMDLQNQSLGPQQPMSKTRDFTKRTFSIASDPEEFTSHAAFLSPDSRRVWSNDITPSHAEGPSQPIDTDTDGDLVPVETVNGGEDNNSFDKRSSYNLAANKPSEPQDLQQADYFGVSQPVVGGGTDEQVPLPSSDREVSFEEVARMSRQHLRNVSSATMIYKPIVDASTERDSFGNATTAVDQSSRNQSKPTEIGSGTLTPVSKPTSSGGAGRRTPKRAVHSRLRPILPGKENAAFQSAPNVSGLFEQRARGEDKQPQRGRSTLEMDLVSDIGDNKAIGGGYVGAIPASFATQMFHATAGMRQSQQRKEEQDMFGRLMMARMNSLEEGFREVIHEMREALKGDSSRARSRSKSPTSSRETERMIPRPLGQRGKQSRDKERETDKGNSQTRRSGLTVGGNTQKSVDPQTQHPPRPSSTSTTNPTAGTAFRSELDQPPAAPTSGVEGSQRHESPTPIDDDDTNNEDLTN